MELLLGRRNTPHRLFGNQQVEGYVADLEHAVDEELRVLGERGKFEIFSELSRLAHRLGFASWAGKEAAAPRHPARSIPLIAQLTPATSLIQPSKP